MSTNQELEFSPAKTRKSKSRISILTIVLLVALLMFNVKIPQILKAMADLWNLQREKDRSVVAQAETKKVVMVMVMGILVVTCPNLTRVLIQNLLFLRQSPVDPP
jgi:hypothetical protein